MYAMSANEDVEMRDVEDDSDDEEDEVLDELGGSMDPEFHFRHNLIIVSQIRKTTLSQRRMTQKKMRICRSYLRAKRIRNLPLATKAIDPTLSVATILVCSAIMANK